MVVMNIGERAASLVIDSKNKYHIVSVFVLQVTDMTACLELISKLERTPITKEVLEVCNTLVSLIFKDLWQINQNKRAV